MANFFTALWSFLETFGNFIVNSLRSLLMLITTLSTIITIPAYISGYIPAFLASSFIIVVAVAAVKLILGRS